MGEKTRGKYRILKSIDKATEKSYNNINKYRERCHDS